MSKKSRGERLVELHAYRKMMGKPTSREMNRSWKSHVRYVQRYIELNLPRVLKMGDK